MLITPEIAEEIVFDSDLPNFDKNFVAIAAHPDKEGVASHCGLVIHHNGESFLFHFDFFHGVRLEKLTDVKHLYYLNILPIINEQEIPAFLAKCELINEKEPDLEFGFAFTGEFFNESNEIVFKVPDNNITNCVFFCISVISGFIISEQYFQYSDWSADTMAKNWYEVDYLRTRKFRPFKKEDLEEFWDSVRRIPPADYFSSASITSLPIRKNIVDQLSPIFINTLKNRHGKRVS